MAEASDPATDTSNVHVVNSWPDCSVCLEACEQPIQLPCLHIFCYLCAKGFVVRTNNCALCRSEVPKDYLLNPVVVHVFNEEQEAIEKTAFEWFYEGRNGWWQYDAQTSFILEETFKTEEIKSCEILIAAFLYVVDFEKMIQYQKNDPTRCRRVKRDAAGAERKGVAGLQLKSIRTTTTMTVVCNSCSKRFDKDEDISMTKCLDCICDTSADVSKSGFFRFLAPTRPKIMFFKKIF